MTALVAGFAVAAVPAAAASTGALLDEVYGGGGNSGATLTNDFIELANRGSDAQDVSSWSVQYISASPSPTSMWSVTPLTGSIDAGGVYLVGEGAGTGGTQPLPPTQATGSTNLSGTAGTVALVNSTTQLTCKTAADCAADPSIVDLVGYGSAVIAEGADAPAATNTTSVHRGSGPDTDDNATDFTTGAPTPRSGGSTGPVAIHDIQGDSFVSPMNGATVTDVPGVVTGLRTSSSKGFWMQDTDPDDDPATSEGIFVYTGSTPTVSPGDDVTVDATVKDYYPLASGETVSSTDKLSITELDDATTTVVSSGNPLPAPIVLSSKTVPATYAPDLGGANIEDTPIMPKRSTLDYYESIEGMRAKVENARVVGPSDSFGEQYVTVRPGQDRTYRGGTELLAENKTPSGRLEVIAADGSNPEVDVDDVFRGATIGAIDYSQYGGYTLQAFTLGKVDHRHLAPVVAQPSGAGKLSVATYNVENLAPDDGATKFARLAQGVVTNLASPDIVALEEIQDNSGADDDGTVAADTTINMLISAIEDAGGPSYKYREIDPVNDQDGGEPGGNIRNVFLFDPSRVSFVSAGGSSVNRSTHGTSVTDDGGTPGLTLSPGRIDPTNPVWTSSRKPLVGEFDFGGKDVFVVANHFDAKLGDQDADGRYQYPERSSELQRAGQALAVHNFVSSILSVQSSAEVVVLGDLNDYQFSPALAALKTGTAGHTGPSILTDLVGTLPVVEQYTYVYDGISEVLDHILVTSGIQNPDYQVVHVNAEYADQVSDHDPQVLDFTP